MTNPTGTAPVTAPGMGTDFVLPHVFKTLTGHGAIVPYHREPESVFFSGPEVVAIGQLLDELEMLSAAVSVPTTPATLVGKLTYLGELVSLARLVRMNALEEAVRVRLNAATLADMRDTVEAWTDGAGSARDGREAQGFAILLAMYDAIAAVPA